MNEKVSNKIKAFNFIFTVFILIYHFRAVDIYVIEVKNQFDGYLLNIFKSISDHLGYIAMTLFFMLSSFLFYFNINTSCEAIIKIKKKN